MLLCKLYYVQRCVCHEVFVYSALDNNVIIIIIIVFELSAGGCDRAAAIIIIIIIMYRCPAIGTLLYTVCYIMVLIGNAEAVLRLWKLNVHNII